MKLYFAPGACSMSCHIAFEECGIQFEPIFCAFEDRKRWEEVKKLNPQGAVPVLVADDGKVLTQNIAIMMYVAEKAGNSTILPKNGTWERAQTMQWLSWVASDLHKSFGPLFDESTPADIRKTSIERVESLLSEADAHLNGKTFLAGNQFTLADGYFFTVYNWCKPTKVPTDRYRNLNSYAARIAERPAVRNVLKREKLT